MKIESISINGRECNPIYGDGVSFVTSMEDDERFYRTELDQDFLFTDGGGDYSWIVSQPFDTEFKVTVTLEDGEVWHGVFWKTDCEFDGDARHVTVKFTTDDIYRQLLDHIDDEVDLVKLAPEIQSIQMTKRPILQIVTTVNGLLSDTLTNILGGMHWEQDIIDTSVDMDSHSSDYHFGNEALDNRTMVYRVNFEEPYAQYAYLNGVYAGYIPKPSQMTYGDYIFTRSDGMYYIKYNVSLGQSGSVHRARIFDSNDNEIIGAYQFDYSTIYNGWLLPELNFIETAPTVKQALGSFYKSYARWIFDKEGVDEAYSIPSNDLVEQNLNYRYCKAYADASLIMFSIDTQDDPTEWGKDQYGKYFIRPGSALTGSYFPVGKSTWSPASCWSRSPFESIIADQDYGVGYTLKDAYPLHSVISVLLKNAAPEEHYGVTIHHGSTSDYCPLYSSGVPFHIMLSQITNVKKTYYKNPAQTGKTSLRKVLDMMRKCFNYYWSITEDGKFVLRFIDTYMSVVGDVVNLTEIKAPRNGRKWDFGQSKWTYEKQELPERVTFAYAEKQTVPFNEMPLEYISGYVQKGETEDIVVEGFSADVDYIVSMMGTISDDGFALLLPDKESIVPSDPSYSRTTLKVSPRVELAHDPDTQAITAIGRARDVSFHLSLSKAPISGTGTLSVNVYDVFGNIILTEVVADAGGVSDFDFSVTLPSQAAEVELFFTLESGGLVIGVTVNSFYAVFNDGVMGIGVLDAGGDIYRVQNWRATRLNLFEQFGKFDMAAYDYMFNEEQGNAATLHRARKQSVAFPFARIASGSGAVVTSLGHGEIETLTWYPVSEYAEASLRLDMEDESINNGE